MLGTVPSTAGPAKPPCLARATAFRVAKRSFYTPSPPFVAVPPANRPPVTTGTLPGPLQTVWHRLLPAAPHRSGPATPSWESHPAGVSGWQEWWSGRGCGTSGGRLAGPRGRTPNRSPSRANSRDQWPSFQARSVFGTAAPPQVSARSALGGAAVGQRQVGIFKDNFCPGLNIRCVQAQH